MKKSPSGISAFHVVHALGTAVLMFALVWGTGLWGLLWWISPPLALFVVSIWALMIMLIAMGRMAPPPDAKSEQRASQSQTKKPPVVPGSIYLVKHGRASIWRPAGLAYLEEWDRVEVDATEEFDALDRLELMLDAGRVVSIPDQCRVRVIRRIEKKDVPELPGADDFCEVLLLDTKQVALVEPFILVPA